MKRTFAVLALLLAVLAIWKSLESAAATRLPQEKTEVAAAFVARLRANDQAGLMALLSARTLKQLEPGGAKQLLQELRAALLKTKTPMQVVCVREGNPKNVWRVDLVETASRFWKLSAGQKTLMIAGMRGLSEPLDDGGTTKDCQGNLELIALGMLQYSQDYDEKLPSANVWCDVLQPYIKSEQALHCPAVKTAAGKPNYGYAMNMKMSRENEAAIQSPAATVIMFDSKSLRRNAFGDRADVSMRHGGAANYAYADGHVKLRASTAPQNFRPEAHIAAALEPMVPPMATVHSSFGGNAVTSLAGNTVSAANAAMNAAGNLASRAPKSSGY